MKAKLLSWLPFAITITGLCGTLYIVEHQSLRLGANDPQIQLADDLSKDLSNTDLTYFANSKTFDVSQSLNPFAIVFSESGEPVASTGLLEGETPVPPNGVLDHAKQKGENRITWAPRKSVRLAIVVRYFEKADGSGNGYILVGRSLSEVEKRIHMLTREILASWAVLMVASLATTLFLTSKRLQR